MDKYSLHARIYPMLVFFMPVILIAIIFSLSFVENIQLFTSLGSIGALAYLFSQLSRDGGKKKEPELWNSWSGAPTTQILRWSNNYLPKPIKKRYHIKLQQLCPMEVNADETYEQINPNKADEMYQSWVIYLRNMTRDASRFPMVLKENMNYGFRRNLWGMKPFAICMLLLLIGGCYLSFSIASKNYNPLAYSIKFFIGESILVAFLLFWIFIVTPSWIKTVGFAYAERLISATEQLP